MKTDINILLVDDSPTDALLTMEELSTSHFHIQSSERLGDALKVLASRPFDIVLLDLGLPDSQGLSTLKTLRVKNPQVAVVVLTGKDDEQLALQALKEGAQDYLVKGELHGGTLNRAIRYAVERGWSEKHHRQIEDRYRTLVTTSSVIVWDCPASGAFDTEQRAWTAFTGQTVKNHRGFGWLDVVHPDDREKSRRAWDAAMQHQCEYQVEQRLRRADGEYRQMSVRAVPIKECDGTIREWVGVHTDVTDQKRAEAEREALLTRLQLHIERLPLAYILYDAADRIVDWNPTAERILGYSRQEMIGQGPPFTQFIPQSSWAEEEVIRSRIRAGDMNAHAINENITKDGRTVTCQCFNTPLVDDNGHYNGYLSVARDITEQKALEVQFRQAQKMEAFGQLAGGVAHDFNNLLTVVNGYSEILLSTALDDANREMVAEILKAGQRSASLTRQLLVFSRQQVLMPRVFDLNDTVREAEKLFRRLIGEDIELRTVSYRPLDTINADPGQIEQVLMNLVVNARDAMPQGGKLTIETGNIQLSEDYTLDYPEVKPGNYVMLSVSDTGSGMTEETRRRLFEPFFTTKEIGKGTGLGLAVVHSIVKQSDGHIEVESEPGVGTSFKIYLLRAAKAALAVKSHLAQRTPPRGTETILLVEDEEALRVLTSRTLRLSGYVVIEAANGNEALRAAEKYGEPIHMLLTDVVMPGMGGRKLTEQLTLLKKNLKVLYISGYTDDAVIRHGILHEQVNFMQKPFSAIALAVKVREVLDA